MKISNLCNSIFLLGCGVVLCPPSANGQNFFRGRHTDKRNTVKSAVQRVLQSLVFFAEDAAAWAGMAPDSGGVDEQKLAMVEFFFATGGPGWINQTDW